ncbi:unnamed protein product [Tilletia controversa]|nr:unnamed protein product [Tilletia controversa]
MSSSPSARYPSEDDRDAVQTQLEEGPARALAYAARVRTFLLASSRYVAYASDIGEAIRPIVTPAVVKAAYAVSWLYLSGDVGYAGYRTWQTSTAGTTVATGKSASSSALPDKDELRRRFANIQKAKDAKEVAGGQTISGQQQGTNWSMKMRALEVPAAVAVNRRRKRRNLKLGKDG